MNHGFIIKTHPLNVFAQMAADEFFCETLPREYILRFYNWERDGITFGYSQRYSFVLKKISEKDKRNVLSARRPTGGGIVYHETDITFSLIFPSPEKFFNPSQTYSMIHKAILSQYSKNGITFDILNEKTKNYNTNNPVMECFEKPVSMDLMRDGRKTLGGALRKFSNYILYQASLQLPDARLNANFHQKIIAKALINEFNISWSERTLIDSEKEKIREIADKKYFSDDWNKRI